MTAIQHCCNPLLPSIACKSIGVVRNARRALWRCFTLGLASAKMHRNQCPFFFLFWTSKKDKNKEKSMLNGATIK